MSLYNTTAIRHAFMSSNHTINSLASRLGVSDSTIENLLRGNQDPGELRVQTLARLADLLGLPAHAMLTPTTSPIASDHPPADETEPSTTAAQTLIALIYTNGATPTTITDLCNALGWDNPRMNTAIKTSATLLAPTGLRLTRLHGELAIVPNRDHTDHMVALDHVRANERGLHLGNYRYIHQLLTGQPTTEGMNPKGLRATLGGLINTGVATNLRNPALTDAAREAFL